MVLVLTETNLKFFFIDHIIHSGPPTTEDDLYLAAGAAWEEAISPALIQDSFNHMIYRFRKCKRHNGLWFEGETRPINEDEELFFIVICIF